VIIFLAVKTTVLCAWPNGKNCELISQVIILAEFNLPYIY